MGLSLRCLLTCWLALVPLAVGRADEPAAKPRLVVVVSVDQLAYDYLERLRDNFADDGFFAKVRRNGAWFSNCNHRHALTYTAPGHAVQLTGTYPNVSGIIDNDWFSRTTKKQQYCVEDADHPLVGPPARFPVTTPPRAKGISPKNLLVATVGDVLRESTGNKAKVFGVTLKDRAAVLMSGHKANGAFWFDENQGYWVSSTYYYRSLPDFVQRLNDGPEIKRFSERAWTLLLERAKYKSRRPDDYLYEGSPTKPEEPRGLGKKFPHQLTAADKQLYFQQLTTTPFGNELVLQLAQSLIEREHLGADDVPDILCVGFSSNDYVGHAFGPYSLEAEDMTYRTDRMLDEFVAYLDQKVGPGRWTLGLTADHGVGPIPEYAKEIGLDGKRLTADELKAMREGVESALAERFGKLVGTETWVEAMEEGQVFLRRRPGDPFGEVQSVACAALKKHPSIAAAFTRDELLAAPPMTDELLDRFRRTFHAERGGDLLFALKPYHVASRLTATHGSPWKYDTHVPCLLLGCGIRRVESDRPVGPAALAPTFAELLSISPPPTNVERNLSEALRK